MMPLLLLTALALPLLGVRAELAAGPEIHSLLAGVAHLARATAANGTEQLTPCRQQLVTLLEAWQERQAWALKAFDGSGSGFENFMMGNGYWLGNRFTCRAVNERVLYAFTQRQPELLSQVAPFPFDYRLAYVRANSRWQLALSVKQPPLLHIGLCVPRSCQQPELEQLLRQTLDTGVLPMAQFDMRPELEYTKQPELSANFFKGTAVRLLLALLGVILLLTLLGSSGYTGPGGVLASFDLLANNRKLWRPSAAHDEISTINGLRVMSALTLLTLHVHWYKFFSVSHSGDMADKVGRIAVYHAYLPYMLEIFFAISGFLNVSNFLRNEQLQRAIAADTLTGNLRRFLGNILHRYLRLLPLQLLVLLATTVGTAYQRETSLFHIIEPWDELCQRHWWRNLLFIQNLFPLSEMCCNWTWSLACDMQLHIVTTLLLYLHTRYPGFVSRLPPIVVIGNLLYTVLRLVINSVPATLDIMYSHSDWLYLSPAVRMLSYIIGCIYGYAHASGQDARYDLMLPNKLAKGAMGAIFLWLAVQLLSGESVSPAVVAVLLVLFRAMIGTVSSHLILASQRIEQCTPLTKWLVTFLASNHFLRIHRVAYAFYLANPLVLLHYNYSLNNALPSNFGILIIMSVAHSGLVFLVAVALTTIFEMPFNSLANLLQATISAKIKSS